MPSYFYSIVSSGSLVKILKFLKHTRNLIIELLMES